MPHENAQFLTLVYSIVKSLDLASSQYDFSRRICGRSVGWFSATRTMDLPLSTEVAMRLIHHLKHYVAKPDVPKNMKQDAEYLRDILNGIIRSRLSA